MTSKELQSIIELDVLCERCGYSDNCPYGYDKCDSFLAIQKDLEVLEILKKHFQGQLDNDTPTGFDEFVFNGIDIYDIYEDGDYKGLKKIKEWLDK